MHRHGAKQLNADIYPSYHNILTAKKRCYPKNVLVTQDCAEVKLQDLLDHTAVRLIQVQEPVLSMTEEKHLKSLMLLSKWGFDGSSGQSQYKQRTEQEDFSDSDIFFTSLVPLQLYFIDEKSEKVVLWQNPKPSSTLFCRPIKFQFKKETKDLVKEEASNIDTQIKDLRKTSCNIKGKQAQVTHQLILTMVDGKVCNAMTSTSSQNCYVCGATPKMMNQLDALAAKPTDSSTFQFGLSSLHAWIRFFECLLHISYRLEVKQWQVRGNKNKEAVEKRKLDIQQKFWRELGLRVDHPKPGGSGTSNDGNTARTFFNREDISSEITGLDREIINRFGIVLKTISSGFTINTQAFEYYARKTAEHFISLYPWYYMPASVHKVLIHGSTIISSAILPIGQMSEEAQEARNKHFKEYRESHSRKISREATNVDVMHRLLETSDPVISSLRKQLQMKPRRKNLPREVTDLLCSETHPHFGYTLHESDDSE